MSGTEIRLGAYSFFDNRFELLPTDSASVSGYGIAVLRVEKTDN